MLPTFTATQSLAVNEAPQTTLPTPPVRADFVAAYGSVVDDFEALKQQVAGLVPRAPYHSPSAHTSTGPHRVSISNSTQP